MTPQNKQVGLIAGGVSLLLVVVWWFAIMSPVSHKLASNRTTQTSLDQEKQTLQSQIAQLKVIASEKGKDQTKLNSLTAQVPDNPQLDVALNDLQESADSAGVTLSAISPSALSAQNQASNSSSAPAGTPVIAVAVTSQGTYANLMQFVKDLTGQPRTFVVTNVGISGDEPKLVGQLGINLYYAGQPTP